MAKTMTFDGTVVKWVDGDTVDVNADLGFSIWSKQRIRLSEVDTPERGEVNFKEATDKARELAPVGSVCKLICKGKDQYGRYIGQIITSENIDVATELLKSGLAKPYKE